MTPKRHKSLSIKELLSDKNKTSQQHTERLSNVIKLSCYIIIGLTVSWIPILIILFDQWEMVFIHLLMIITSGFILTLLKRSQISHASHILTIVVITYVFIAALYAGEVLINYGKVHYWLWVIVVALHFVMFKNKAIWLKVYMSACLVLFMAIELNLFNVELINPQPDHVQIIMNSVTLLTCLLSLIYLTTVYINDIHRAEIDLEEANGKMENLLLNILPEQIAIRLQNKRDTFADGFAECSVLFADIVGFTRLSANKPAEEIVSLLNDVFGKFDELTEKHGAEKIKTIGDAYMVAAGVPEANIEHASTLAKLALDMQQVVAAYPELQIRIGINSGPVVAGIIGKKRFIYDLWGDTVNLASRMESHGLPDGIQVSEATYQLIKNQFDFEYRGGVNIKDKGVTTTYLLKNSKSI
jgi:class 3 adenylate cyclase